MEVRQDGRSPEGSHAVVSGLHGVLRSAERCALALELRDPCDPPDPQKRKKRSMGLGGRGEGGVGGYIGIGGAGAYEALQKIKSSKI